MTDQAQAFAHAICAAVKIPFPGGVVGVIINARIMFMSGDYQQPYEAARLILTGLSQERLDEIRQAIMARRAEPYTHELVMQPGREERIKIMARYVADHLLAMHDVYEVCAERGGLPHQLQPA